MQHLRIFIAALAVAAALLVMRPAVVLGGPSTDFGAGPSTELGAGPQAEAAAAQPSHEQAENAEEAPGGGWMPVVAKAFNFTLLVGVLVYFLRVPLRDYLNGRITRVREDLVTAAQTRELATKRLAEIQTQLAALPAEISALKRRGAEEIAAERVRIDEAAAVERQRLLEHTRREIDARLRLARRDLIEHAATLATEVASARIRAAITPDDQARLLDRYSKQLEQEARS